MGDMGWASSFWLCTDENTAELLRECSFSSCLSEVAACSIGLLPVMVTDEFVTAGI